MVAYVVSSNTSFRVCVASESKSALAAATRAAMVSVIIGLVMMVIVVAISFIMGRSFTEPIKSVNASLARLADGHFSKIDKYAARKDELGAMVTSTNSVIDRLDGIVAGIKQSASTVDTSSEELSNMAEQIAQTSDDVSTAVQDIAAGATQQADEIQTATENVSNISEAINSVRTSADELRALADKMKEDSSLSASSLSLLKEFSEGMTSKIDDISAAIESSYAAVTVVSEKFQGISTIADQTNLLSLNASIEAARAGEAGRGFSVVAEEIGKLANDSSNMANEISKEVEVLTREAGLVAQAAEALRKSNADQQGAIVETLSTVNGMLDGINETVTEVQRISDGAETCVVSKDVVAESMTSLSAISEENAASSEETGASMEELSATVTVLAESAKDLRSVAESLREEMEFFKDVED